MSMMDVAKYLSYSDSIDLQPERERFFNLSMANSGRLFSCLNSKQEQWSGLSVYMREKTYEPHPNMKKGD